MIYFLNNLTYT